MLQPYSLTVEKIIFGEPFRSMPTEQRVELVGAIAEQMGLPESVQETVKALVSDYQPDGSEYFKNEKRKS